MFQIPDAIRTWVDILVIIGGIGGWVATAAWRVMRLSLVTHADLSAGLGPIGEQVDEIDRRMAKVEGDIAHLPDSGEWAEMREQMIRLEGGVSNIDTQVRGLRDTMERIERPLNVLIDGKLKAGT